MADSTIHGLTQILKAGVVATNDELPLWDADAATTKRIAVDNVPISLTQVSDYPTYVVGIGGAGYADFATAVATLNAGITGTLVVPPGTHIVGADLAVDAHVHLHILKGALIHVEDTYTLTINGTLEAENYQIFSWDSSGKFVFGLGPARNHLNVAWWGAKGEGDYSDQAPAINKALQAVRDSASIQFDQSYITLHIPSGQYWVASSLNATKLKYVTIEGEGDYNTQIIGSGAGLATYAVLDTVGFQYGAIRNLWIRGHNVDPPNMGILMARASGWEGCMVFLDHITIDGYFKLAGFYNISVEVSGMSDYRVYLTGNASASPKYGIFLGGDNKDSVASAYATPLANSLSTFRLFNGFVGCGTGCPNFENIYLYSGYLANINGSYFNGGTSGNNTASVHINGFNFINITDICLETGHDYSMIIDEDIKGLNVNNFCFYGAVGGLYQPTDHTIKGSVLIGSYRDNMNLGISSNNQYNLIKDFNGEASTLTLQSTEDDIIQPDNDLTLSVTAGGVESSTILGNPGALSMLGSAKAGVADGTTAGKCKTTNAITYRAQDGTVYTKAGTDDFWDLTAVSTGVAEYMKVALCINSSGTASIVQGTKVASQAAAKLPDIPLNILCLGYVQIPNSYAGGDLAGFVFYDK